MDGQSESSRYSGFYYRGGRGAHAPARLAECLMHLQPSCTISRALYFICAALNFWCNFKIEISGKLEISNPVIAFSFGGHEGFQIFQTWAVIVNKSFCATISQGHIQIIVSSIGKRALDLVATYKLWIAGCVEPFQGESKDDDEKWGCRLFVLRIGIIGQYL